jgi:hypothetical protein
MLEKILLYFVRKDAVERKDQRQRFDEQFNDGHAEPVAVDSDQAKAALAAVYENLQNPRSAVFLETHVRHCPDGILRAAGRVQFAGRDGEASFAGYTVEIRDNRHAELLDLAIGFNPVTVISPADVDPEAMATMAIDRERKADWEFLKPILFSVGVFVLLMIAYVAYLTFISH